MGLSSRAELEKAYEALLMEVDPRIKARPDLQKAFAKKLVEFTETWGKNFPGNPEKIKKIEKEILDWIDTSR